MGILFRLDIVSYSTIGYDWLGLEKFEYSALRVIVCLGVVDLDLEKPVIKLPFIRTVRSFLNYRKRKLILQITFSFLNLENLIRPEFATLLFCFGALNFVLE